MARLIYSGDLNIEYGGLFYSLQTWQWDYVNVLRVTPCNEAGGPDNCFWVERLTVNIRKDSAKQQSALDVLGVGADQFKAMKRAAKRHVLIDAHIAMGFYDTDQSSMVRIGMHVDSRDTDQFKPDTVLRGNTSLMRYAREQAHAHCD